MFGYRKMIIFFVLVLMFLCSFATSAQVSGSYQIKLDSLKSYKDWIILGDLVEHSGDLSAVENSFLSEKNWSKMTISFVKLPQHIKTAEALEQIKKLGYAPATYTQGLVLVNQHPIIWKKHSNIVFLGTNAYSSDPKDRERKYTVWFCFQSGAKYINVSAYEQEWEDYIYFAVYKVS